MCIEHKQYWECCRALDGKSVDPCDLALEGYMCNIEEKLHRNAGLCVQCSHPRGRLRRAITYPPYSNGITHRQDDSYDQPPSPTKYKVVKSQPLKFPEYCYPQPERGRTRTRTPPPELSLVSPIREQPQDLRTCLYTEPPLTPPSSDEDDERDNVYHQYRRVQELRATGGPAFRPGPGYRVGDIVDLGSIRYRVASPRTVKRLQKEGLLPQW